MRGQNSSPNFFCLLALLEGTRYEHKEAREGGGDKKRASLCRYRQMSVVLLSANLPFNGFFDDIVTMKYSCQYLTREFEPVVEADIYLIKFFVRNFDCVA